MIAALPLAVRIGGPIALAAIIAGGWYLYKESIRDEGRDEVKQEVAEQIQEQQALVDTVNEQEYKDTIKTLESTKSRLAKFNARLVEQGRSRDAELAQLKDYVDAVRTQRPDSEVKYVEVVSPVEVETLVEVEKVVERQTPCVVPEHLVDSLDNLARVLNEISGDGLPDDEAASGESPLLAATPVTCDALYDRIELLTARNGTSMINHRGLSDYVRQQYARFQAFERGEAPETDE